MPWTSKQPSGRLLRRSSSKSSSSTIPFASTTTKFTLMSCSRTIGSCWVWWLLMANTSLLLISPFWTFPKKNTSKQSQKEKRMREIWMKKESRKPSRELSTSTQGNNQISHHSSQKRMNISGATSAAEVSQINSPPQKQKQPKSSCRQQLKRRKSHPPPQKAPRQVWMSHRCNFYIGPNWE